MQKLQKHKQKGKTHAVKNATAGVDRVSDQPDLDKQQHYRLHYLLLIYTLGVKNLYDSECSKRFTQKKTLMFLKPEPEG